MRKIYSYKNLEMEFKDINSSSREVVFQFANYGNVDSYGDISTQGMFSRSINNNFSRIKHLQNHDINLSLGKPLEIWDDSKGAYMRSKITETSFGKDFLKMAEDGLITESSYGYSVVNSEKSMDGNNVLKEVKLWEASSLTAWGANEFTPMISLKSDNVEDYVSKVEKRIKSIDKFCKNSNATDETIELLLIEIKQLHSLIIDLKSTDSVVEPTSPSDNDINEMKQQEEELLMGIKLLGLKFN